MGVDIKSIKNRIKSVNSTLHLTNAMGLVASAKIKGATVGMIKSREYFNALEDTISMLSSAKACEKSAYMKAAENQKVCLVVMAGDRGLAGGYNNNVFKLVEQIDKDIIYAIGKRACEKYGKEVVNIEGYNYSSAIELAQKLCSGFSNGEFNKVGIVSTKYISMMTQEPKVEWLLPLKKKEKPMPQDVIFEPDEVTVLEGVIEEYISAKIILSARESFTCEVVQRRFAMDLAEKNATEMIDNLTLEYNRARQGTITQEITEIVAGSGV